MDRSAACGYLQSMRRKTGAALASLLACLLATGCGLIPDWHANPDPDASPDPHAETCVDWVRFETAQQLFDDAPLVVIGTPRGRDGKTSIYGYSAQIHLVEVETVLKGQPGPGPLRVASTPETCTGGISYPGGDPLDGHQRMLIYASKRDSGWSTLTPAQGAVPVERGAALPFRPS